MNSPLADLDAFLALPRLEGLALSPDGARLVTTVKTLSPDATRHVGALWELDPTGQRPARRLSSSRSGEQHPVFTADGALLFTSSRPDPQRAGDDDEDVPAALWRLPPVGEARVVGTRPGGVGSVVVARDSVRVAALCDTLPSATDEQDDEQRRRRRKDRKVTAVLHAGYPVRHWDADLGPDEPRLLVADVPPGEVPAADVAEETAADAAPARGGTASGAAEDQLTWRDLTPQPGRALDRAELDLTPDGSTIVTTWSVAEPHGSRRTTLVAVAVAVDSTTAERRTLADDGSSEHTSPRVSPDGRHVAFLRERRSTPTEPVDTRLMVVPLDGSEEPRALAPDWDRWAAEPRWLPDGVALVVTADEGGGRPVFRVEVATGQVTRLTGDRGHYTDLQVAPDGSAFYALRDAVDAPPAPVRLDPHAADQEPVPLRGPAEPLALPGSLTEVTTTADDGTALRAWLVLPTGADPHSMPTGADPHPLPAGARPHPLLVWCHGGPLGTWNGWSWRWQPWRFAARGYAVLLPDPALSTGYGLEMVRRGWGDWGGAPYRDVLALTDAALERADLDQTRTAAMGGSYGGYLVNWIAGHTDRFRAIVTHASLWDLTQFAGTTDHAYYWLREMTPAAATTGSPSAYAAAIRTPMLVVHGDDDDRVPVGESLRLWWDLVRHSSADALPHRFLLFPDEGHWVLRPQNAKTWYETVEAFLAWHLLGESWQVPDVLG